MRSEHSYEGLSRSLRRIKGGSSSSEKGCGRKGKGKDRDGEVDGAKKERQYDKSKVKYYNCQNLGHFTNECELLKRDKSKEKEKIHMAQEDR